MKTLKRTIFIRTAMMLTVLMCCFTAKAQETLTVYDGTDTNNYTPFYGYYADYGTRCQFIIPASDLADLDGGVISALTFYTSLASASFNQGVTIYLKEVDYTTFGTAALEDWSSMTAVYTGTIGVSNNQMTISFTTPYTYEGGNLMIGFQVTTWGTSCPSISWYGVNQSSGTYTAAYNNANNSHTWNSTVNQQNFIPKTTFTYEKDSPTCPRPTNMTVTAVTASAATIGWTSTASKWNLRYKESGVTDWITADDVTNPYPIENLMANTTYNVQVQAVYDGETSKWASTSFTTVLGLPYRQYFETANIPAGWQHYSGLLAEVQADPTKLISGTNDYSWNFSSSSGAYITFSGYAANGTKNWLVTPAVALDQASNLSFDLSLRGGYYGNGVLQTDNADDRFIVLASIDGGTSWTQLALWDNAGSERVLNDLTSTATTFKLNFPADCAGKSVKVAFYAESTESNASNRLYLDNVVFDDANRCIEPTDLTSSNVTSRTATVGWTSDGDLFNLQYKAAGDANWTTVNGINATTYTLTGLTPTTVYTFRVQTDCGASQSIWSEEGAFTTLYGIPFTETFTNSSRPAGWTSYSTLMSGVLDGTTKLNDHQNNGAWGFSDSSGDYYAYVNLYSQYGKQWLVIPDIIMDRENCQLTFDLRLSYPDMTGTDDQFAVLVTEDGGDTWSQLALWNNTGSERIFNNISYNGEQVALDLSAYNGKTIRLAFYAESTVNNADNVIYVDNVLIDVKPAVDAHRPQNMAVSNITKNSATITWDADDDVTQWNIQYGLRKSSYRYEKTSDTNSYTLTLLNAGTNYEVLVQAISADGNSSWSNISFVTAFPEDNSCDISYVLKSKNEYGWNGTTIKVVDNTSGIEVASLTLEAGKSEETGTIELCNGRLYNFLWLPQDYYGDCSYSFYDVNGDEFLYADAGKTGQKTTLTSYTMDCTTVNCHQPKNPVADEVGFYSATVSWTPGDADQTKWEVVCRTSYGTPSSTLIGTEVTETSYTFSNLTSDYTYYIYVRGVKDTEKSKWSRCVQIRTKDAKALPSDLFAYNETYTTAVIEWTANGAETKWELRYGPYGGSWTTISDITLGEGQDSPTYTLTGLTPNTQYAIQVRAAYDDNTYSSWTASEEFWTEDDKALPSDLTLIGMTTTTATVAWDKNGAESKWNVRYRKAAYAEEVMFDDFEYGLAAWTVYTQGEAPQANGWYACTASNQFDAHSGSKFASAWSWYNNTAYNADNWLITPKIDLQGTIKFWVLTNKKWPDSYAVLLSTTGNAIEDFTVTLKAMAAGPTTDEWTEVSIDLSDYTGQQGYIAIRHVSNNDNYLFIDDAGIYINETPAGEWQTVTVTEPTCTLIELDNSEYEVQVQAVYDDESTGDWTDSYTFPMIGVVLLADDDSESSLKNADIIDALIELNEPVDIMLYDRTLYRDGGWNTLCLPFNVDLTTDGCPLAGATALPLTSASITGTTLNLTFGNAVNELVAGTPYIIKWGEVATDIENPVFTNVTIDPTDRSYDNSASGDLRVRFLGTYKSTTFDSADPSILFMGAENSLYYPESDATIGAFRAYFKIGSDEALSRRITDFNINYGEGNATEIEELKDGKIEALKLEGWYDLSGRRLNGKPTQPGVYLYNGKKIAIK